jgi:hypothetical protein
MRKSIELYQSIKWWFVRRAYHIWKNGWWKTDSALSKIAYSAQWKFANENYGSLQKNIFWWCILKTNYNANQDTAIQLRIWSIKNGQESIIFYNYTFGAWIWARDAVYNTVLRLFDRWRNRKLRLNY